MRIQKVVTLATEAALPVLQRDDQHCEKQKRCLPHVVSGLFQELKIGIHLLHKGRVDGRHLCHPICIEQFRANMAEPVKAVLYSIK